MNTPTKMTSIAIATVAAGLFALNGPVFAAEQDASTESVHCAGVNACKGMSSCKTADNSCAGQNSCKGKGWLYLSKSDCAAAKAKMKQEEMKK